MHISHMESPIIVQDSEPPLRATDSTLIASKQPFVGEHDAGYDNYENMKN